MGVEKHPFLSLLGLKIHLKINIIKQNSTEINLTIGTRTIHFLIYLFERRELKRIVLLSPVPKEMQPSQCVVILVLLLVTLATSAPLVVLLRTLELLLGDTSKQEEEEENISQNWGHRCLQHCLALSFA